MADAAGRGGPLVRTWALPALAIGLLAVAALVFWPRGWAINRLVVWIYFQLGFDRLSAIIPLDDPGRLDFSALLNGLMLVPAAALAMIAFPRLRWWRVAIVGSAAACVIETMQWALLSERRGSIGDAAANSAGALAGALLGHGVNGWLTNRSTVSAELSHAPSQGDHRPTARGTEDRRNS